MLTGSFAIIGIISGAGFELIRETWKSRNEIKKKELENKELLKRNFWSPLYHLINKNYVFVAQYSDDFPEFCNRIFSTYDENLRKIDALISKNIYIMPEGMAQDLCSYLDTIAGVNRFFEQLKESYDVDIKKGIDTFEKTKNHLTEFVGIQNRYTTTMLFEINSWVCENVYVSEHVNEKREELQKSIEKVFQ